MLKADWVLAISLFLIVLKKQAWIVSVDALRPARKHNRVYDLIIIGAGASGLFASGSAQLAGQTCCLIEEAHLVGGDCTNAACVPSKALRSFSSSSHTRTPRTLHYQAARSHMDTTVQKVREREDPDRIRKSLDLYFGDCKFTSPHEVEVSINATTSISLYGKRFLLATGASPVIPDDLQSQARKANLPLLTYRSLLNPESVLPGSNESKFLDQLQADDGETKRLHLLIVGGGATACELGSSLAKFEHVKISWVAPSLLPHEDIRLQEAALNLLIGAGVELFRLNVKVKKIRSDKSVQLTGGTVVSSVDAVLMCVGRSPGPSLESLHLSRAGIEYTKDRGVTVHPRTLQSVSARHVYAAGDCASAVPHRLRTASQAAWTGFHAVRNAAIPRILTVGGTAIHRVAPRVIYTEPELACVGLTLAECVSQYGLGGFDVLYCPEAGSDRADMDSHRRDSMLSFVELRATKRGRVLGFSACGPAAAELANAMGLAISAKLTTRDVARAIFGYPSHGYIVQRVAMSLALKDVSGFLSVCGPLGKCLGAVGRSLAALQRIFRIQKASRAYRTWQAEGCQKALYPDSVFASELSSPEYIHLLSYNAIRNTTEAEGPRADVDEMKRDANCASTDFDSWMLRKPAT